MISLALAVRGIAGNPSELELNSSKWKEMGPFELSPERGRFALVYSVAENKSWQFSLPLARFATPDLGYLNGKYVSLFAPGLSLAVLPGYYLGRAWGVSQIGSFAIIALFALINLILIAWMAKEIGAGWLTGLMGGVVWLFGTPAFSYAVNLYQHQLSTMIILLALLALIKLKGGKGLIIIWLLIGIGILVDYPNGILMMPIILAAIGRVLRLRLERNRLKIYIRPGRVLTLGVLLLPLLGFCWLNRQIYGNPWQLAGTVASAKAIDAQGRPTEPEVELALKITRAETKIENKRVIDWFLSRNLRQGFQTLLLGPDRGTVVYALAVSILGAGGLVIMEREKNKRLAVILGIIGINIVFYAMWGDPWGGWAFGARYLIPAYALLGVATAVFLEKTKDQRAAVIALLLLFVYSAWVNTAGAISSSANPPLPEVLNLEQISQREEKYTVWRNIDEIKTGRVKAAIYVNTSVKQLGGEGYMWLVYGVTMTGMVSLTMGYLRRGEKG